MEIKGVHFDLTDLCNAGCPQCARTNPLGCGPQDWLLKRASSLEDFRRHAPEALLADLDYAYFCGNFGDPAVVPELPAMLAHCWQAQPRMKLKVFTNASIRSTAWWRELGEQVRDRPFRLIAAIDGASHETNRRYRVRTDFARILENLDAFMGAGGEAEWRMLVFKHNEHEVEAARALAAARGFREFRAYPSNRFGGEPGFTYADKGRAFTLEPPTGVFAPKSTTTREITPEQLPRLRSVITCEAVRTAEAFIDFMGHLLPCCHVGLRLYAWLRGAEGFGRDRALDEAFARFDMRRLNIDAVGFPAARDALDAFVDHLGPYWGADEPRVCKLICGKLRPVEEGLATSLGAGAAAHAPS